MKYITEDEVMQLIAAHVKEYHGAKRGRFIPPTLDEIIIYQVECPELQNVDAKDFYRGYADAGWIDTQGKPVRNWKLKLRTRSNIAKALKKDIRPAKHLCCVCGALADFQYMSKWYCPNKKCRIKMYE